MVNILAQIIAKGMLFFALHINPTGAFPPALSAKEERKYLTAYKNGDMNAKNVLIEHNLRLIAHIVKKYHSNCEEQEDLISIGTIGLIKAVNTFNPDKGIKLVTYASKCIENEILMYFRGKKRTSLEISISEPIDTDSEGNPLTLIDIISEEENIADMIDLKIRSKRLYDFIEEMEDERERAIIIMRYGLYMTEAMTQREVALRLGISRSYVSRIEKKVLLELKRKFDEKK